MKRALIYILLPLFIVACSNSKKLSSDGTAKKKVVAKELSEYEKVNFGNAYLEGTKEKILENYARAIPLFQRALDIDSKSAAAHYEIGLCYEQIGEVDNAFMHFEQATSLEPDNYWFKLSYASHLKYRGDMNGAINSFKELVELKPNDLDLKKELSTLLLKEERYKESIKYINQIEDEVGINKDISFLKQQIYLRNNDVDGAANEIRMLIEAYPDEIEYYGILSDIYLSNGREKEALKVYKEMEDIAPENYMVQFSVAEYYRVQGDKEKFNTALNKAFSSPEMSIDEKVKYMLTFYQVSSKDKEKKAEAIELCKTIAEAHPTDAKSHALLADYLYFDGQAELAKASYIRTIELDSSRYPIWNQLLLILYETEDKKGLVNYGERAINLFPNQPTNFFIYGVGLSNVDRHEDAIETYLMGVDLVIDNPALKSQFYSSIGDSYHSLKDNAKSDEYYEKSLELEPNNVYVLNNYSYYLSVRKEKLERAEEMSKKANDLAPGVSSFQDTYAWILYQKGEYKEANKWIDKALKSDKEVSGVILEHKGDILFKLNKKAEAVKYWEKASKAEDASDEVHEKVKAGELYEFKE